MDLKTQNIQNSNGNTNINFMWLYPIERPVATQKIINGGEIELHDIIPNNESMAADYNGRERFKATFFLQNVVSWAMNFPNNTIRIVRHPIYSYILTDEDLNGVYKIKDLNERSKKIKEICETRLQEQFNTKMTLQEIEAKYDKCFGEFEKNMHEKGCANFSIVKFEDLANEYLHEKTIRDDEMLRYLLKEDCLYRNYKSLGSAIDAMRVSLNYYGMGYEKNLTLDMDNSLGTLQIIEFDDDKKIKDRSVDQDNINNLGKTVKVPAKISDHWNISADVENSLLYTYKAFDSDLSKIKMAAENSDIWKYEIDSVGSIYKETRNLINSEKYTEYSQRLTCTLKTENLPKYCLRFYDNYYMNRTFNNNDITSSEKTNLPIVHAKDFWPQDEFFKKIKPYKTPAKEQQAILHEIYKGRNHEFDKASDVKVQKAKS